MVVVAIASVGASVTTAVVVEAVVAIVGVAFVVTTVGAG